MIEVKEKEKMAVKCPECGRTFKTVQGRHGHLNFYHGYAKETPFTRAIRWEIRRHMDGVKEPEVEKIKGKTKEERREKAIGVLREYEKSLAETGDKIFIEELDMETEDSKFIEKVVFE